MTSAGPIPTPVLRHGGCLCGTIRFTLAAAPGPLLVCHCTHCQKAGGAGASFNTVVPAAAVQVLQGRPRVFAQVVDSGNTLQRHFCADCGSPLWSLRAHQPERLVLKMGALDPVPGEAAPPVAANIWLRSARPWQPVPASAESFPQGRP